MNNLSRLRVIQLWFAAVAIVGAAWVTFGAATTSGTAGWLLALSLVPPAIVLMLWPRAQMPTAADVIRGR